MCSRCCIADDLADVPCRDPACNGSLEPETLSIRRFLDHQSMRPAVALLGMSSSFELPLPGWAAEATRAGLAAEQLEPLRCTGCNAEHNSLVQCLRDLQLCDALFREGRKLLKEGRRADGVKNLKRSLKLAKAWLRPNGYALLEILGALAMAYTEAHVGSGVLRTVAVAVTEQLFCLVVMSAGLCQRRSVCGGGTSVLLRLLPSSAQPPDGGHPTTVCCQGAVDSTCVRCDLLADSRTANFVLFGGKISCWILSRHLRHPPLMHRRSDIAFFNCLLQQCQCCNRPSRRMRRRSVSRF
jgi:hypothetical protein